MYPTIDRDTFESLMKELLGKAKEVRDVKESAYFSAGDVTRSFRKCAEIRNKPLPTMIIDLGVKHFQSICDLIDTEFPPESFSAVESVGVPIQEIPLDTWDEKFVDLINYIFKCYAAVRYIRGM